jgi:hypothetical protein
MMVALGRFIIKLGEKGLPFFKLFAGTAIWGPLITGENLFFCKIIKMQTNSQIANCIPCNHGLVTGAHGPGTPG